MNEYTLITILSLDISLILTPLYRPHASCTDIYLIMKSVDLSLVKEMLCFKENWVLCIVQGIGTVQVPLSTRR